MAKYQVRNKKIDTGQYEFGYGKGSKKITARVWCNDVSGNWQLRKGEPGCDHTEPQPKLKELKAAWGEWAEAEYDGGDGTSKVKDESVPPSSKPARPASGPPKHVPKGPPKHTPKPKAGPPSFKRKTAPASLDREFKAGPFDPRFVDTEGGRHLTSLGVLVEIESWVRRYQKRIKQINEGLAKKEGPGFDPFDPLIESVRECLNRECPDVFEEKQDDQPAPEPQQTADPEDDDDTPDFD